MMSHTAAEQMFGSVHPVQATGRHMPDPQELKKHLTHANSVGYLFCVGCGFLYEVPAEGVARLVKEARAELKEGDLPHKRYFEIGGCGHCNGDQTKVELKTVLSH